MLSISLSPLRLVAFSTRVKVNGTQVGVVGSSSSNEHLICGSTSTERSVSGTVATYNSEEEHVSTVSASAECTFEPLVEGSVEASYLKVMSSAVPD